MRGHDFDHNGKCDSRDYYIYTQVCENGDNKPTSTRSTPPSSGGKLSSEEIYTIVALFGFLAWIKGLWGYGFLGGIIGIICGGYLFLRIAAWAYS